MHIYILIIFIHLFRTSRKEWATSGERAELVRHDDNLHIPEGQFTVPDTKVHLHTYNMHTSYYTIYVTILNLLFDDILLKYYF